MVLDFRLLALLAAIGLILSLGIYQLVLYSTTQHPGRRSAGALASIFVGLALILLERDVTIALADWSGLNNIGWYLGYVMGAVGCYLFAQVAYVTDVHQYGPQIHRMLRIWFMGLLFLLTGIYVTQMVQMPEWPVRTPRTVWELLFSVSYFTYCIAIASAVALTTWQGFLLENNPAQRLRLFFGISGNLTALFCFVGKLVYLSLTYIYAELIWLDQLAMMALAVAGFWFCLSVAPGWFLRMLVALNPIIYIRQLWTLYWINRLAFRVYGLMPGLVLKHTYVYHQLHSLQICIYQILISILDGQRELAGCLQMEPERQQVIAGLKWNGDQRQQATALDAALRQVGGMDNVSYQAVVRKLVQISREVTRRDKFS